MEEKELYAINWDDYLKPDRKRQSGTQASVGWIVGTSLKATLDGFSFVLPSEGCMTRRR